MDVTVDDLRIIASLAYLRSEPAEPIDSEGEQETAARMDELIRFAGTLGPAPASVQRSTSADPSECGDSSSGSVSIRTASPVVEAPDEPQEGLSRDVVLANAPDRCRGHVRMPPIAAGQKTGASRPARSRRRASSCSVEDAGSATTIEPATASVATAVGQSREQLGDRAGRTSLLAGLSVAALAGKVRSGELSARQVTESCLARIEAVEPVVGAYLEIDRDGALARAEEIDRAVAAGEVRDRRSHPLLGVPVAIKDNLAMAGRPLTCGSRILEGYVAPVSAAVVERLLAAGAVPVGRTNLDELAMGSSCETSFQSTEIPTRNPWDPSRVPGGSSGGSAATVGASCVPVALGSDTGGSVRQPAALCGVVGFRPTWGRVSRRGLVAFASSLDQVGPIARTVEDAALALAVIAGPDPRDATCAEREVDDLWDAVDRLEGGLRGWRIGTIRELDRDDEASGVTAGTRAVFDASLAALAAAGAEIVEVSVPAVRFSLAAYAILAAAEASSNLARFDGVRYGRRADRRPSDTAADLVAASRSDGFGEEVTRRILLGTFALSAGYAERYYGRAQALRTRLAGEIEQAFERADVLVTPTAPAGAFHRGERLGDSVAMARSDVFTTPASLAGLPAISIPCGLDPSGLPLGLQLMAPAWAEGRLLGAARAAERLLGFELPLLPEPPTSGSTTRSMGAEA